MARLAILMPLGRVQIDEGPVRALGAEVVYRPCPVTKATEEQVLEAGAGADAIITASTQPFTERVIHQLENCKLIAMIGTGVDGVDVDAATELGICIANNPFYSLDEVSDHAMALILASARKLTRLNAAVKARQWAGFRGPIFDTVLPQTFRLRGQTLGLIGFGNVARALAPKAQAFGLRTIAYSPSVAAGLARAHGVQLVSLEQLFVQSDFVSLHAMLSLRNHHLLGLDQFRQMKPTAYVINTARGGLIDEVALCAALQRGYVAGAALDVMEDEPLPLDSPLLEMDNVILTPHSASYSEESQIDLWRWPVEEAARVFSGGWPIALVNPAVKQRFAARWRSTRG